MSQRVPQNDDKISLRKIIFLVRSRWFFFLIVITVTLGLAYSYNTFTPPTYRVTTTLLIEEEKKQSSTGNDKILDGFDLLAGMKNLDNQLMVLTSKTLINRTLNELSFDTEFFYHRFFNNNMTIYPDQPIRIVSQSGEKLPADVKFSFKYSGNNDFRLDTKSKSSFELHTNSSFGKTIEYPGGSFRIERGSAIWPDVKLRRSFYFIFHSRNKLLEGYRKRLLVKPASKKGTIVKISIEGTNKTKELEFLKKFVEIFVNVTLEKKNIEAIRTVQFIDDQLVGISDSLLITENKLQQFRSTNRVMDLSAQGQAIINQVMNLENEKARLGTEANYYGYLAEYLTKDATGEVPVSPATIGITDPGLTRLVTELADLQGQLYSKSLGDKNPLQSQLTQRARNIKEALKETLNGVRRANKLAITDNQEQIRRVNEQASLLPRTEREYLGIERKYKLNDALYTFFLEKRAMAQIQKASNVADNEVIDPPEVESLPVKPRIALIYLIALMAGAGFPFFWIVVAESISGRVKELDDIRKATDIPVSGHIPHSVSKSSTLVLDEPESPVAEAFRSLRSRMQFFTKEIKSPVILITSSMPREGKTFTAINLASAYCLMGRKTVLLGFDLRQPRIYNDFELDNEHGVSTWLIGKDKLPNIIKTTQYDNLYIITAGPVPPNPAELTSLEKTDELLKLLRKEYDCIIMDSSPIGTVSDALHLASLADTCMLIVRQKVTFKDSIEDTIRELKIREIKSLSIVFNDFTPNSNHYGYGGKYKYPYKNDLNKNGVTKSKKSKLLQQLNFTGIGKLNLNKP